MGCWTPLIPALWSLWSLDHPGLHQSYSRKTKATYWNLVWNNQKEENPNKQNNKIIKQTKNTNKQQNKSKLGFDSRHNDNAYRDLYHYDDIKTEKKIA